ncbi:hypothetical protein [Sphingomonas sp. HMP9]|nr:hypothetical protein [Sphingomonas sp. HMP9]
MKPAISRHPASIADTAIDSKIALSARANAFAAGDEIYFIAPP